MVKAVLYSDTVSHCKNCILAVKSSLLLEIAVFALHCYVAAFKIIIWSTSEEEEEEKTQLTSYLLQDFNLRSERWLLMGAAEQVPAGAR